MRFVVLITLAALSATKAAECRQHYIDHGCRNWPEFISACMATTRYFHGMQFGCKYRA